MTEHDSSVESRRVDGEGVATTVDPVPGLAAYNDHCMMCHRFGADLLRSKALNSSELWKSVVIDGVLADNGVRGLRRYFDAETAEDLRDYILKRARDAAATENRQ